MFLSATNKRKAVLIPGVISRRASDRDRLCPSIVLYRPETLYNYRHYGESAESFDSEN